MKNQSYTIIKSRDQYDRYCNRLEEIIEKETNPNEDEIELLSLLIDKYNEEQSEVYQMRMDPVEILVDLLSENQMSQIELSRKTHISPQLLNDIIKYRREITKSAALKLGEEFGVKYYAFLKPYKLKKAG